MSTGKYSPICPHANKGYDFKFNCFGELPVEFNHETYDEKTMFADFDAEGFDSYGYSAFDVDGNFVGIGAGIDRLGYTEMDYLSDAARGGSLHEDAYGYSLMVNFIRKR